MRCRQAGPLPRVARALAPAAEGVLPAPREEQLQQLAVHATEAAPHHVHLAVGGLEGRAARHGTAPAGTEQHAASAWPL